jgi:hypothetical protein
MENNLMKYNINELKKLYINTDDDFKKFFIKKAIEYKIYILKNNKLQNNDKNDKLDNNMNNKNDTLDDLIHFSNNSEESNNSESENDNDNQVEEKFVKQLKFDSANNKLLERLNVESNFRSTDKKNMKKQFVSPFAEDNLYNDQFKNDKYIESIKKVN